MNPGLTSWEEEAADLVFFSLRTSETATTVDRRWGLGRFGLERETERSLEVDPRKVEVVLR